MNQHFIKIFFLLTLPYIGLSQKAYRLKKLLFQDDFKTTLDTTHWFAEVKQMPDNQAFTENRQLVIDVSGGATVWLKQELGDNWLIEFDRTVPMEGGKNDRLSDFNLFWQASDKPQKQLFGRIPDFANYDSLSLYYIGFGGNTNTTTRFRKYNGAGERLVLQEYLDAAHLLEANKKYHCRLIMLHGTVFFYVNNALFFTYKDPKPLKKGYFGFRTTQSRHWIETVKVYQISRRRHFFHVKAACRRC